MRTKLNSGDIIEILTSSNQRPNKDWLNFVTTSKARNRIRSFLRSEQREQSRNIGKEMLEQELHKKGFNLDRLVKTGDIEAIVKSARESRIDDVFIAIGYGRINAKQIVEKAFEDKQVAKPKLADEIEKQTPSTPPPQISKTTSSSGVLVGGLDNCLVSFSRCCNPLPGEDIVGFITRGRGVTIHRTNCPRALDLDPERRIPVVWTQQSEDRKRHNAFLKIVTQDRQGVLAEITSAISCCEVSVKNANIRLADDMTGTLDFELSLRDLNQLNQVITRLESIPGIISVQRKNHDHKIGHKGKRN